jgi:hypothetical protein
MKSAELVESSFIGSLASAFAPDLRLVLSGVWAYCQNPILLGQAPSHIDKSGSRRQRQRPMVYRRKKYHKKYQRMVALLCGLCADCLVTKLQASARVRFTVEA